MLNHAHEAKAALQAAMEGLQRHGQAEDADAVDDAIHAGEAASNLLEGDVAQAKQAVARWRLSAAVEAKLGKALSDGTSVQVLSKAIQVTAEQTVCPCLEACLVLLLCSIMCHQGFPLLRCICSLTL